MIKRIEVPFFIPDIDNNEIQACNKVLKSGWLTTGKKCEEFEKDFLNFLGEEDLYAVALSSATAGLHLALEAIGVSKGDEVITTTHTFTATAEVIRYLGAEVVFVDIDPKTNCLDLKEVEKFITKKTKCILPVHFAGITCDMNSLLKLANSKNIAVIEDSAHSLPSTYNQKLIGTLNTKATIFSFYANKSMTTAEGGMLVTRDKNLYKRVKTNSLHGIDRDAHLRFNSSDPAWFYQVVSPGYKYNLNDISAAIGIEQLKKLYPMQKRRQKIAEFYNSNLNQNSLTLPPNPINKSDLHSWHIYNLSFNKASKLNRDSIIKKLAIEKISTSVHYIPLHMHKYWKERYKLEKSKFPNSTDLFFRCISLPIYSKLSDLQVEYVIEKLKNIINI